jgi:hypothetical protein
VPSEEWQKYWLEQVQLAENEGFRSGELKEIEGLVLLHQPMFLEAWHAYFQR